MNQAGRTVTIQGNAAHTVIITGDGNRVTLGHHGEFAFRLLDEAFRRQQQQRAPADFYNGTRPNWANIARGDDARRNLLDRLLDFITASGPTQRAVALTGLSGEGKTTLLMRLAWETAEAGFPVLWRHYGTVSAPYECPFAEARRVLIFIDELPYAEELPRLLSDLNESGLPFTLIGTARQYEWANSPLRPETARLAAWQEFPLERLTDDEARRLLEKLEERQALGTLAQKTPAQRLRYLLDRLQADGQLLPALLTARQGKAFEAILEDVFAGLERRWGAERAAFLLRGYAGIALTHRFGFWTSRPLLARFLNVPEADLTPRLIQPLIGELAEINEAEGRRLYTRHPWIAERSLALLCGARLPEEIYLYADLFRALGDYLGEHPRAQERKLTTLLPLAFKYRGNFDRARQLFQQAAQADPSDAPTLQAWALMEKDLRNYDRARQLFQQAAQADPTNAPTLQAWALMEKDLRNYDRARQLFQQAAQADPSDAPTLQAWALMEKDLRNYDRARQLFQQAAQAAPTHAPTLQAWALMEKDLRNYDRARQLFQQAAQADPTNAPTLQAWALMEKDLRNYDRARQLFQQAAQADPSDAPTLQAWALMEAQQGNPQEARRILEDGLKRVHEPRGRALLLSTLGSLLARQGQLPEAEARFRQALALDERNPLTHYHFAVQVLLPTGRRDEACQHLRRALELRPRKERHRLRIAQALERHCNP